MILDAIKQAYIDAKERNFSKLYFYFDIHKTILLPDYNNSTCEFYPYAKETLQLLSKLIIVNDPELVLGLYTCSYPEEIERYQKIFKDNEINFQYVNENPEVKNTKYGCFEQGKFYFNLLVEDKSGFKAQFEWKEVYQYFLEKQLNSQNQKYIIGCDIADNSKDLGATFLVIYEDDEKYIKNLDLKNCTTKEELKNLANQIGLKYSEENKEFVK